MKLNTDYLMGLPVNISELIHGKTVEWGRLELNEGWNPDDVLHSVCAFANDVNNWGGGYIFISMAEKGDKLVLSATQYLEIQCQVNSNTSLPLPGWFYCTF